ncbi:MAG: hypothetical protein ABWX87_13440, partial [Pseudoxanthomonas sp.]
ETAEEARVSERSEFPRRAVSGEEHRAPPQRGGECQALAVLATFCQDKSSSGGAAARKLLILPFTQMRRSTPSP